MKKKTIIRLVALFMIGNMAVEAACAGIGGNSVYAAETDAVESEYDGDDSEFTGASGTGWILDEKGLLTISGEPKYVDSSGGDVPEWCTYRDKILSVKVEGFKPYSISGWFDNCSNIRSITFDEAFDTSNVKDMGYMFYGCSGLTSLNVSSLDTSNVTDMSGMFQGCSDLTNLDVSGLDTSNVTDMGSMFQGCSGLTTLDVSGFDTSNVTDMAIMFSYCSGLTTLDVSGFDTSNVTDMRSMFSYCSGLTTLDVSGFDTSNVTNMSTMFYDCSGLTSLDVSSFDTSSVTDMSYMFYGCSGLTSLDVSGFDTSNVTYIYMNGMFSSCSSIERLKPFMGFSKKFLLPLAQMYDLNGVEYTAFPKELTKPITLYASKPTEVVATSVALKKKNLTINTETRYKLSYTYTPIGCTDEAEWSSSDSSIVSVNSIGLITSGTKEGTAVITVSLGAYSDSCKVTVGKAVTPDETYRIIFDANGGSGAMSPLTASVGKEITLPQNSFEKADNSFSGWNTSADGSGTAYADKAKVKDLAPADGSITLYAQWKKKTPEPTKITQVTPTATPTPTATVSAPSVSDNKEDIPTVTPTPTTIPESVTGDTISTKSISGLPKGSQILDAGESVNLKAVVTTADGVNGSATWIAPVGHVLDTVTQEDGSLEIKAVGPGTAYVTAVSGSKTKTVKYNVKQTVKTLDASANVITLGVCEKYRLCITPDAPTTDKFYFESSDKNICSVDQKGLIKAKKAAGSATITIYAYDKKSEKKNRPVARVAVKVEDKEAAAVSVTDASINYLGNKELYVGEMGYISTLINGGANNGGAAVKYTMDNKGVVKIDTYGHVTAKKAGTVTITATCGEKTDSVTLTVKQPLKLYKVNKSYVKIAAPKAGKSSKKVTFTVKTNPTAKKFVDGGGKVIWIVTSKDTGISLKSDNGKGKAVFEVPSGASDTIVTATISDPVTGKSYRTDCVIDVK
ncbi:MAG: BspA family leucine-rich repeat surface protein [Lachnospiraceae bacterium]|nr:BspA family leucine-rich repeat surface protein [Lachnospiraceae bacterium]